MSDAMRDLGRTLVAWKSWEEGLAVLAEAVRQRPSDHRSRVLAARCMAELGERERAVTVLHIAAEGLLARDYLLSAIAACKQALRINPLEKRLRETLLRVHARASSAAQGKPAVPEPVPSEAIVDADDPGDLTNLRGSDLSDRSYEVLAAPDTGAVADADARPPLPLFSDLSAEAFVALAVRMGYRELTEGAMICKEGDAADTFYVLVAGKAEVTRWDASGDERTLAFLTGGALVGELAVILGAPRTASVACVSETDVFEISRDDLNAVGKEHPDVPRALADFAQRRMARSLLASAPLFTGVSISEREALLSRFHPRVVGPGEKVLVEGETGTGLYLVLAGELLVQKKDPSGGVITLGILREGDVAGEISLLTHLPATATVVATRKTVAAFVSREEFLQLLTDYPHARGYFQELSQKRLSGMASAFLPAEVLDADELVVG
jgi:CRP-like cAMP-binding protein